MLTKYFWYGLLHCVLHNFLETENQFKGRWIILLCLSSLPFNSVSLEKNVRSLSVVIFSNSLFSNNLPLLFLA